LLRRALLLPLLLLSSFGHADEVDDTAWRAKAHAVCAPRDGARCDDIEFLRQHYGPQVLATREVARRAAVRGNREEQRATRELLLQYSGLCEERSAKFCASNPGSCSLQLQQSCQSLKQRAVYCQAQTRKYCARQRNSANCNEVLQKQCPSAKPQDIDQLLARYDDLTPVQKQRIKQLARQLKETRDESLVDGLISSLMGLLGLG
jgi:hypothetical protein